MQSNVDYRSQDKELWEEELADFVPERVFDAHIHLCDESNIFEGYDRSKIQFSNANLSTLKSWAAKLYPGREVHFLVLGTPFHGIDPDRHNPWAIDQVQTDPQSRFNFLVTPETSVEAIATAMKKPGVVGLKPYRFYSITGDSDQCRIHEFLPHEQLELANDLGLWVTMHLSRLDACADAWNLDDLEEYTTKKYPKIRWILAHCARSFTYWPIRHAVERLRDLPNIWYDLSAVTDLRPILTLFQQEDLKRIFYGSDGVDPTYFHGAYNAMGRSWYAVDADKAGLKFPYCSGRPTLSVYEQLLSMKHAAEIAGLSKDNIEGIFWRHASEALAVDWEG